MKSKEGFVLHFWYASCASVQDFIPVKKIRAKLCKAMLLTCTVDHWLTVVVVVQL